MAKKAKAATQFFAVKSFFKWTVEKRKVTSVEERVILVEAKDFKDAIKKAEKESKKYLERYTNPFGLKVTIEALDYYDAYIIDDEFKTGLELFSTQVVLKKPVSDKDIIKKLVDFDEKFDAKLDHNLRHYFRYLEFNGAIDEKDFLKKNKIKL